jgi:hypothetical protein
MSRDGTSFKTKRRLILVIRRYPSRLFICLEVWREIYGFAGEDAREVWGKFFSSLSRSGPPATPSIEAIGTPPQAGGEFLTALRCGGAEKKAVRKFRTACCYLLVQGYYAFNPTRRGFAFFLNSFCSLSLALWSCDFDVPTEQPRILATSSCSKPSTSCSTNTFL